MLALTFSGATLFGGCDGKSSTPHTPATNSAGSSTVTRTTTTPDSYPAGIIPANGNAGPGAVASPKGGTPAPTAGDGTASPKQ